MMTARCFNCGRRCGEKDTLKINSVISCTKKECMRRAIRTGVPSVKEIVKVINGECN